MIAFHQRRIALLIALIVLAELLFLFAWLTVRKVDQSLSDYYNKSTRTHLNHESPLSLALNEDPPNAASIRRLLLNGANPNERIRDHELFADTTPLIKIIQSNFLEPTACLDLVKLMRERGADINATDQFGKSPLQIAAIAQNVETARFLISQGANIN